MEHDGWWSCGGCGDELEVGVEHECPVLGSVVLVTLRKEATDESPRP